MQGRTIRLVVAGVELHGCWVLARVYLVYAGLHWRLAPLIVIFWESLFCATVVARAAHLALR